jgi:hypothetical protein
MGSHERQGVTPLVAQVRVRLSRTPRVGLSTSRLASPAASPDKTRVRRGRGRRLKTSFVSLTLSSPLRLRALISRVAR